MRKVTEVEQRWIDIWERLKPTDDDVNELFWKDYSNLIDEVGWNCGLIGVQRLRKLLRKFGISDFPDELKNS